MPTIAVRNIRSKRRHLNLQPVGSQNFHDAETGPDRDGPTKQALDVFGSSVGGYVVILRGKAEQLIADAAARPQGLKTLPPQPSHYINGKITFGHS
jgi:hypothetical protein